MSSAISPTLSVSPTSTSTPIKSRSSRLHERVQRTRRHRQWVSQSNASIASGSTGSETASSQKSQKEKVRSKLARVAEEHLRHKKLTSSPTKSPTSSQLSPRVRSPRVRSRSPPDSNAHSIEEDELGAVEMTLSQTNLYAYSNSPETPPRNGVNADASYNYEEDHAPRGVAVDWPDEMEDERPQEPAPSVSKSRYTPVPPKKWQKTPSATESMHKAAPLTKTPVEPAKEDKDTFSQTSISSEPARPSWQRGGSVTKRYAPWEKPHEQPDDQPPRITPNKSWQTQPKEYPDPEPDTKSDVGSAVGGARSAFWKRRDAKPQPSASGSKLAPWQKPPPQDYPDPDPDVQIDVSSAVGGTRSWQRPDARTAPLPPANSGQVAPWQKPQKEEEDGMEILHSGSRQTPQSAPPSQKWRSSTPSYEIGRQGAWQKPKSPPRPKESTPPQPDLSSSGRETPSQLWKRRQQELQNTAAVKPGPKKIAPRQQDMQPQKPANEPEFMPRNEQSRVSPSPNNGRASSRVGKVQTPSWVKPTAAAIQTQSPRQIQASQPSWAKKQGTSSEIEAPMTPNANKQSWAKKQAMPSEIDAPLTPRETINSDLYTRETINSDPYTAEHDYLRTPVPSDVASSHGGSEFTPSFGGAVIETPMSQSVASLRASLGSKPAPPPLPGLTPARATKSPGRSPWLAGNRKTGNNVGSPYLGGNVGPVSPPLSPLSGGQAIPAHLENSSVDHRYSPACVSSASTSVTSNHDPYKRSTSPAMTTPRTSDSPLKSLAELAADSAMITDYPQLQELKSAESMDDEESMLSSAVGTIPSNADLPTEFRGIVQQRPYDSIVQQYSQESNMSTLANDRSPTSLAVTAEDTGRRIHLHERVENYTDDDEASTPSCIPKLKPPPKDERNPRDLRRFPRSPARRHPSEVSADVLNRIRTMGTEFEGSDAGGSSAAVFTPDGGGMEELNGILGDEVSSPKGVNRANPSNQMDRNPARGSLRVREIRQALERQQDQERRMNPVPFISPDRSASGASHILKFFNVQSQDSFTGEEENKWASRDPDFDTGMMRDESPSPEPYDSDPEVHDPIAELDEFDPRPPSRPPRHPTSAAVHFEPDPDDPFYAGGATPEIQNSQHQSLNPDDVFGTFWSTTGANTDETFDFDEAEGSFFSSTSEDKGVAAQSPFRVVLKPPRPTPATRSRRQQEAASDYDSHYATYGSGIDEWKRKG